MTDLRVAPGLKLSLDFVTKTAAILAQRRKGKTYTASVLAEELVSVEMPFVALDPTGAWWGLRASANGRDPGLPVVILGGQHGDVPLERTAGKFVAELVVDEPGYYVIDFSLFESGAAERQFATDFAERLYRRKGQPDSDFPLHLFVDEADRFVPQRPGGGRGEARETDQRLLGAFEAIVRRGGLRGLGTTLISQRAAVVNKNVLEQVDLLIILRTVGPNDRRAVEDYVRAHGSDEERAALMGSLASLELGEAWFWEPGAEPPLFERVQIRERHTFNSSATPKPGERRVEPRQLAPVDLEAIKEQMAATIERAQAEDPKALQARIRQLEKDLGAALAEREPERVVQTFEVETLPSWWPDVVEEIGQAREALVRAHEKVRTGTLERREIGTPARTERAPKSPPARAEQPRRAATTRTSVAPAGELPIGETRILTAIAQYPGGASLEQLTVLTGYKRSSRNTYLQRLSQRGFVRRDGAGYVATEEGVTALGPEFEPLPTGRALQEHWLSMLPEGEKRILSELIGAYPAGVEMEELSDRTGYKRSSRNTYIQRLRSRQLVTTGNGEAQAAEVLFDG